jgi:hypothetical protein
MKVRELLKKIDDKLRPPHVKGADVNDAFTRGSEEAPSSYIPSQQDDRPPH